MAARVDYLVMAARGRHGGGARGNSRAGVRADLRGMISKEEEGEVARP